jgi:hypothetical protein
MESVRVSTGSAFPSLLAVLFIGLKLTGYISWPWLWVLAPIWAPIALVFAFILLGGIVYGILTVLKKVLKNR